MKKYLITLSLFAAAAAFADNDVHTGELSGDYWKESHVDSIWRNTYVKNGSSVIFSHYDSETDYTRADFTNANLSSAGFERATLAGTNFHNANLTDANFLVCDVDKCRLCRCKFN
ncbi:pentapeptide repeat-containing protein [Opitutia bacterium KCR 482]|nr:pentapeptide repeat-containing protein [Opitutae bacterium KCR 482]